MKTAATSALWILALATAAAAQVQDRRFLEEERRREMDERERANADLHQPFLWEAGAWLHLEFIQLDDPPEREERTLRYADLRTWAEARIERRFTAYLRLQTDYADFNSGDQFEGEDDDEARFFRVDQAYLEADLSSEISGERSSIRLGRTYFSLGRGLLFNGVAYGGQGSYATGAFGARAFVAHSIPHDDDPDTSLPNADDSNRFFSALEIDYAFHPQVRTYLMALVEKDLNDEDPDNPLQDWTYDANYLGLGARGGIVGGLGYALEGVYESGSSVAAGSTQEEDIQAFSLTALLDYRVETATSPYFALEYMYGSGDADRGSVAEVAGGNLAGTDDESFFAFGFVQTGFSLFPRLSNLHIIRLAASFRPLESTEEFRYLEVGAAFYSYRKDEAEQPISDPRSFLQDEDVGSEFDLHLRWRVLSDVGFSAAFGRFLPGDAYADDDPRNFFMAGLTYSF